MVFFFSNRNDFSLLSTSTLLRHVSNYDYDFKPYENVLLSVKKNKVDIDQYTYKNQWYNSDRKNKYT